MTVDTSASAPADASSANKFLFWACFLALVATAFGFMIRGELIDTWGSEFGLNEVEKGQINGVGVWPMGVSIVLFSLFIDKIGYGRAMIFAFAAHVVYAFVVIAAPNVLAEPGASEAAIAAGKTRGYWMLYIGNLILALGNGTVEACINPVVATIFSRQKTKWLNVLHAGWPGGLVLAGVLMIALGTADWRIKVASMFIPVILYGLMMLRCTFPVNERVAAGASYREMLAEFGIGGALIIVALIVREMLGNDFGFSWQTQFVVGALAVGAFGVAARSLGRPMLLFLMLIMIPLATTEIGTDGWITSLMKPEMTKLGANAAWVLVYTSFIMMVLRFSAGPIVHRISPLGLLAVSSVIAACGLFFLSKSTGVTILVAATIYGFGKTFFWPTMLGVVSERFPKGGALTLNATGGVGMLGVGVLGFPLIGLLQENTIREKLPPAVYAQVSIEKEGVFGQYKAVDPDKIKNLSLSQAEEVTTAADEGKKEALATMAIFPCVMFVCYVILIAYFRAKGGYQAEVLTGHAAKDQEFTGGVSGPMEA